MSRIIEVDKQTMLGLLKESIENGYIVYNDMSIFALKILSIEVERVVILRLFRIDRTGFKYYKYGGTLLCIEY